MNGSVSISCLSNVILDFGDNIIYIDYTEEYIDDSKYKIEAFIDIERNVNNNHCMQFDYNWYTVLWNLCGKMLEFTISKYKYYIS